MSLYNCDACGDPLCEECWDCAYGCDTRTRLRMRSRRSRPVRGVANEDRGAVAVRLGEFFVAENVSGIAAVGGGSDFKRILTELEAAGPGYALSTHLYQFEDYGIPQTRHRYIIVGFRRDLNLYFDHPAPTWKTVTARQALANIHDNAANHTAPQHSQRVVEMLGYIRPGENAGTAALPDHLRPRKGASRWRLMYRKVNPDKPSHTVTASEGGGKEPFHWDEPRGLTNREQARLQTFPDDYRFEGPAGSVRRQIGMAVPPEAARLVFQSVKETLNGNIRTPRLGRQGQLI